MEVTCSHCQKNFQSKRKTAKFCSVNCRVKSHNKSKPKKQKQITIDLIKSQCPENLSGLDRTLWISEERKKHGI